MENHILFTEARSPGELDGLMGEGGWPINMVQTLDQIGKKRP